MKYQIGNKNITNKIILIGFGIGVVFWIVESYLEVLVLHRGAGLSDHIFLSDPHVIFHRSVVVILLIMFGALAYFTVTRHKKSEEVLRKERDIAQKYLDVAGVMIVVINAEQKVALINKRGCKILGYSENEVIGKNWFDNFIPESIRDKVRTVFGELMAGKIEPVEYFENTVLTSSGEEKTIEWHNTVIRNERGEITSILSSGEDVTDRKKAEVKYKTIIDTTADGFWVTDTRGNFLDVNNAYSDLIGYSRDELLNMNIKDLEAIESQEKIARHIQEVIRTGYDRFETRHRRKDEGTVDIEVSTNYMDIEGGRLFVFLRDITERKLTEKIILQSKLDWENTFDTITDMITIHDKDFNLVRSNKTARKILDIPSLEINKLIGCHKYYHGKDCPPEWGFNCEYIKEGNPLTLEFFEPDLNMFVEIRAIPRFDDNNQFVGLIHVIRDITERKKIAEELIRTQKLSSLGRMLAGIGHEIKNPLAGIGMVLKSMQGGFEEEDARRQDIARILHEIRSLEKLLDNIVKFSRPRALTLEEIDITIPIENALIFVKKALADRDVKVERKYLDSGLKIYCDPDSMQQAFINLFLNSVESMESGGVLSIDIHRTEDDRYLSSLEAGSRFKELKPICTDSGMQVVIKDTGYGIKKENLEKIFEPYFTTKHRKTGLGLYITHQIVKGHGGKMDIYSKEGQGTCCVITLPQGGSNEMNSEKGRT